MHESDYILEVKDLKQYFYPDKRHVVKAVDGVSFQVRRGSTFGLVGESGSGKSTIGKALIRLNTPTAGSVLFDGEEIAGKLNRETRQHVTDKMQMIFQDPMASLNPKKKIIDIVAEGLDANHMCSSRAERTERVCAMLEAVGLSREFANRYPHMFSGGQRQRVGIARAIIMNPELIIADECISALDVSIQAQVVNLLKDLQAERRLTYLFIAHDLSMVKYISDYIGVLHLGHMEEMGKHDYQIGVTRWYADYQDALTYLDMWISSSQMNYGQYNNPDYDAMYYKVTGELAMDTEGREAAMKEMEAMILGDAAICPLYQLASCALANPDYNWVKNVAGVVQYQFVSYK